MENTTTNNTQVTPASVGVRYGLIVGVISVIISFALMSTHNDQGPLKWLSFAVLVGGIFMAHNYFKQHNGGFMRYGQGLSIGTILSGITGLLGGIFTYIYVSFIDNTYLARTVEASRAKLEEGGKLTEEQIDQAMSMSQSMMTGPMMLVMALIGSLIGGFVISLIISAITKRTRPEFE
ncbi:DUF4199 domain-containing protein [Hymenobacter sp. BT175]|uniref:DUF4199 domain-containing protein n=1 Tax=Hymenobacter translucens TaxID=2886507 RepID=UPI001D0E29AE|nr:DUF4199 domain-containing protein [Hymenobacter translucens]MCC2546811.1 DUF4199 domain-containing protein [Hymenobacter translucens]